jgi:hypothetical protein
MKKVLLVLSVLVIITGCNRSNEEPKLAALTSSEISGERLWQRITEESDYRAYGQWKGHDGLRPGQSPHGTLHIVYINKPLYSAVPIENSTAPYGSIIVKENYDSSEELKNLTVMAKVEGYSPEINDWFWAAIGPEGEIMAEGSPESCVSCHAGMRSNDYIIIKNIDEPQAED